MHGVPVSKAQPAPVILVEPHLSSPGSKHQTKNENEEYAAPRMPGAHGCSSAKYASQPKEPRRPQGQTGESDVEKAQGHEPMHGAFGHAEAVYFRFIHRAEAHNAQSGRRSQECRRAAAHCRSISTGLSIAQQSMVSADLWEGRKLRDGRPALKHK